MWSPPSRVKPLQRGFFFAPTRRIPVHRRQVPLDQLPCAPLYGILSPLVDPNGPNWRDPVDQAVAGLCFELCFFWFFRARRNTLLPGRPRYPFFLPSVRAGPFGSLAKLGPSHAANFFPFNGSNFRPPEQAFASCLVPVAPPATERENGFLSPSRRPRYPAFDW